MEVNRDGRPTPRAAESIQRALLLAVLDPTEFGGSVRGLANDLGEPEAAISAAAAKLEQRGLVYLGNGHVMASGAVLDLDALQRLAI